MEQLNAGPVSGVTAGVLPTADRKSLALHAAVAHKLLQDGELVQRARLRVAEWQRTGSVHEWYASQWAEILSRPMATICTFLIDDGELACTLRQVSPFAGVLTTAERLAVLRSFAPGSANESQPA
ncbi:MAG: hypothetical protein HY902_15400 [Deltaproteobacteria bacterium]|nr:hypothetical protein [Deltaproteobacteria bacterium]